MPWQNAQLTTASSSEIQRKMGHAYNTFNVSSSGTTNYTVNVVIISHPACCLLVHTVQILSWFIWTGLYLMWLIPALWQIPHTLSIPDFSKSMAHLVYISYTWTAPVLNEPNVHVDHTLCILVVYKGKNKMIPDTLLPVSWYKNDWYITEYVECSRRNGQYSGRSYCRSF
jgi:hypothetical protein